MKVVSVASLLAFAFTLNAQLTATLNRSPARPPEVVIRNNSTMSVVAFAFSMAPVAQGTTNGTPLVAFVGPSVDITAIPLLPNQEHTVPVPIRFRPGQPAEDLLQSPIITAGIFADGSTTGDGRLLDRLILRRCNMLQAVETALEMLSDAGRHNVARDQLIRQFRRMADSLNHWYLPPEQQVGRSLYQSIIGRLLNLPEVQIGSPFPPTSFAAQQTAMLNRQRVALLESYPGLSDVAFIGR